MWCVSKKLVFVFLSVWASFALAWPGDYDREAKREALIENNEYRQFAQVMYEAGLGTLMTPPKGILSPAVRKTQKMLDEMINELVPELRKNGVSIVVNIYASEHVNAFVRQMDPNSDHSREKWWKKEHPRKIWPVRKAWGFYDDGKPIYEIGITSALIEALHTKDQLAFPLGHELKHLTEGHTDPKQNLSELLKHWWDSQAREGVADSGSLQYMAGKYELEAALTVLELLHPRREDVPKLKESIYKALDQSAKPHHAEGVRFTFVQTQIIYMRSHDENAAPRAETPLPDFVQAFKKEARARVKVKPAWWVENIQKWFPDLENADESKKEKVNKLLKMLFEHQPDGEKNPLRLLNPELKYRIKKFLVQNSIGSDAWTMEDFFKINLRNWSVRDGVLGLFMTSPEGLKFISDLGVIVPEWKKFFDFWSSMDSFARESDKKGRRFDFYELKRAVENLGKHNPLGLLEPIRLQLRSQLIQSIAESNTSIFNNWDSSGNGTFDNFLLEALEESDLPKKDPDWLLELQKAFRPHARSFVENSLNSIRHAGILENKNGLFFKYYTKRELQEALEIVEKEVLAVEHSIYPSDRTPDGFFIIGELLQKYQNDPNMLRVIVKKTYRLFTDENVRNILVTSISILSKNHIFDEFTNEKDLHHVDFLTLLLASEEGRKVISKISFDKMKWLFGGMYTILYGGVGASAEHLFELLAKYLDHFTKPTELIDTFVNLYQLSGKGFVLHPRLIPLFKGPLMMAISRLPLAMQIEHLKKKELWLVLGPEFVGTRMAQYAQSRKEKNLAERIKQTLEEFPLQKDWLEAYQIFRERFTEKMRLQPSTVHSVFPLDERSDTEKARDHDTLVRALSALSTFVKDLALEQQIEVIEYMMGRQDNPPDELERASALINDGLSNSFTGRVLKGVDARLLFLQFREKLQFQGPLERAFAINTVLAGTNSILSTSHGLQKVIDQILSPVSAENRPMAQTILNALLKAEGKNKTLILSYILAQKPTAGESKLTEAMVLRSLLDFYGVPGVKLAQYLAFTSAFKNFTAALESYQNAAMPISFYDALVLVQKHLGNQWNPKLYRLTRILGSGSVNIAIEYENLKTGKLEVLTISRDQIATKTKEDFRRFRLLIEAAMESQDREKLEFLIGLLRIIEKSVSLEFDKPHAFKMQKAAHQIYRRYVDEWRVQSVDAFEVMGDVGIRMQKAPGISAIDMLRDDPATYKSAMRALMSVEFEILRGVAGHDTSPIPLYANPDFHNGQVLIDAERRTVTILDFGQTVEISNAEREFALDFLMIIAKGVDEAKSMKLLEKNIKLFSSKHVQLDPREVRKILNRSDRMEIFVYLLSYLERRGFEAPLPVVHWLLGAHRLAKLGELVGVSMENSFTWMLGMRKMGVSLATYNAGKVLLDNIFIASPSKVPSQNKSMQTATILKCQDLFISSP